MKANMAVELDGCAFTLDEAAFAALRTYLEKAGARLGDHPDRAEVLAGLERSIATQLGRNRGAQRLVDARELDTALAAVGRVDGPAFGTRKVDADTRAGRRRLYRLRDGRKIAGVCTGLAAFTEIDVSLIRLGFILGTLFSGGALCVAYVACLFLMPVANTPEEIAAAHSGRAMI